MVNLILIRHGYSVSNKSGRYTGQSDVPLDDTGRAQAMETAEYIAANFRPDKIYCSDLCRAYDTIKPIADATGLDIITTDKLREVDVGGWQGLTREEVARKFPETYKSYIETSRLEGFDGGENYVKFGERVVNIIKEIAAKNEGKTVIVGTHGGVIRSLRATWLGFPPGEFRSIPHVHNASVTLVQFENGTGTVTEADHHDHLTEKTI